MTAATPVFVRAAAEERAKKMAEFRWIRNRNNSYGKSALPAPRGRHGASGSESCRRFSCWSWP